MIALVETPPGSGLYDYASAFTDVGGGLFGYPSSLYTFTDMGGGLFSLDFVGGGSDGSTCLYGDGLYGDGTYGLCNRSPFRSCSPTSTATANPVTAGRPFNAACRQRRGCP